MVALDFMIVHSITLSVTIASLQTSQVKDELFDFLYLYIHFKLKVKAYHL